MLYLCDKKVKGMRNKGFYSQVVFGLFLKDWFSFMDNSWMWQKVGFKLLML